MVQAEGRTVKHQPEPDERLADVVFFDVNIAVVFGLERDVTGIEALGLHIGGEFAGQGSLSAGSMGAAHIHLIEFVADDLGPAVEVLVAGELIVQIGDPTAEDGLGFRRWLEFAIVQDWHGASLSWRSSETAVGRSLLDSEDRVHSSRFFNLTRADRQGLHLVHDSLFGGQCAHQWADSFGLRLVTCKQ
jgi:hypothetical protein